MMGKRWIGRWVIGVSLLHTLFGFVVFGAVVASMLQEGLWNSVGENTLRGAVAWFLLSGGFMFVAGVAIDACEGGDGALPLRASGWSLLVVTLVTIILMPISGAWLLLPPSIAMILRRDLS